MDFGDIKKKASEALGDEATTDQVLDRVEDAAKQVTGGKFDDKIETGRDFIDGKLGEE